MMVRCGVIAILSVVLPLCAAAQDAGVLAVVDGEAVTADAFADRYGAYLLRTGMKDNARMRDAMLTQMVNDRLITADAYERGIGAGEAFRHFREGARRKLLVEAYLEERVLVDVEVSEADLEEAFVRINTEISARHLYARTREDADLLRRRLEEGESFESLAREVFVDTALANSGGSVGTFSFDDMDPDFEDAAFGLSVGEISQPVRTAQGYSIIQVTDRFTKPILTESEYAERKAKLWAFVLRKERLQARSHYVRARARALGPAFGAGFDALLAQVTGVALAENEQIEALLARPLVTFGEGAERTTWTVGDFRTRAAFTAVEQRAQVRSELDLKEFITGLVVRDEMLRRAEAMQLDGRPAFAGALQAALDEWALTRRKEQLAQMAEVSEDSIRAHFEQNLTEFRTESGEPMTYERARPLIAEQLRFAYTRDAVAAYVADLRRAASIATNRRALMALEIGGRSLAAADTPARPGFNPASEPTTSNHTESAELQ